MPEFSLLAVILQQIYTWINYNTIFQVFSHNHNLITQFHSSTIPQNASNKTTKNKSTEKNSFANFPLKINLRIESHTHARTDKTSNDKRLLFIILILESWKRIRTLICVSSSQIRHEMCALQTKDISGLRNGFANFHISTIISLNTYHKHNYKHVTANLPISHRNISTDANQCLSKPFWGEAPAWRLENVQMCNPIFAHSRLSYTICIHM